MSIRFYCPLGHRLKVPDHRLGKKGRCPICRERVIVPSLSLPRVRKVKPSNGEAEPVMVDSSPGSSPRTFDQCAAEFLTRETEISIAEKMEAITNQALKKLSSPAPASQATEVPIDAPPDLELPVESQAAPAATVAEEPVTSAAFEDQALLSFFASSTPLSTALSTIEPPASELPPAQLLPPSPPSPLPISPVAPPTRSMIAAATARKTTWWTWSTWDSIAQYAVCRPTAPQLEATYWLASLLPFAIVLCAAPAVGHLRLNAAPAWAQAMLLLAGAQLVYAVWLALLPDYSTLRVGLFLFAASALLEGLGMVGSLSTPAILDLSSRGTAAVWCGGCLVAMAGLSYACAKVAARWTPVSEPSPELLAASPFHRQSN